MVNLDEIIERKANRGKKIVHNKKRRQNCLDNLADVLEDLLAYAKLNNQNFDAELATARRFFQQDCHRTSYQH